MDLQTLNQMGLLPERCMDCDSRRCIDFACRIVKPTVKKFECIGCGARLDLEPCICRHGEDWGNMPEAAEVQMEFMADGGVWR